MHQKNGPSVKSCRGQRSLPASVISAAANARYSRRRLPGRDLKLCAAASSLFLSKTHRHAVRANKVTSYASLGCVSKKVNAYSLKLPNECLHLRKISESHSSATAPT